MTVRRANPVLVACVNEEPCGELASLSAANGWLLSAAGGVAEAFKAIRRNDPAVVVLQVSPEPNGGLELLRWVTREAVQSMLIAAGMSDDEALERAARAAGARWYFAKSDWGLIEPTVLAGLEQASSPARLTKRTRSLRPVQCPVFSSSSFPSDRKNRAAGTQRPSPPVGRGG